MISGSIDNENITIQDDLIAKYTRPGPRYTSYPTAPQWKELTASDYQTQLKQANQTDKPLSLYFHIPFCDERCTFCACSVVATPKHQVAKPYLDTLIKEIELVAQKVGPNKKVEQLHWGGGTPTYLNCEQIEKLFTTISKNFSFSNTAEISIEIDPRVTTTEQFKTLRDVGFNRVSMGVQDFNRQVQELAGRLQPFEMTQKAVETARDLKFESVNIDLVYGLPLQSFASFDQTIKELIKLDPDRIALFNFAYVPWMYAHQKKILESDLPSPITKMQMFLNAIAGFENQGYDFIGLDHFAKKDDSLCQAKKAGSMYRNFQGYTTKVECDLVGMGVTSIGYVANAFIQNEKKLKTYQDCIAAGKLASIRGLKLNNDDLIRQWVIKEIFCHQKIAKEKFNQMWNEDFDAYFASEIKELMKLEEDQLINLSPDTLTITAVGRLFLRNIGMVFDAYFKPTENQFSKTA